MRCTHCGAMIPDDMLYCPECHMEVQIVPDYNPLEDVLAQEVKGSIEGRPQGQIRDRPISEDTAVTEQGEYSNSTRVLNQGETGTRYAPRRNAAARQGASARQSGHRVLRVSLEPIPDIRRARTSTGSVRQGRPVLYRSPCAPDRQKTLVSMRADGKNGKPDPCAQSTGSLRQERK